MAIIYPQAFTEIKKEEVKYERSVTEETCLKFALASNMFSKLACIGSVRAVQINQVGVQIPDSNIWQIMDGSEITNPSSPLRTMGLIQRFTPNMVGKYVRAAADYSLNPSGGSQTVNLMHSHNTGSVSGEIKGEEGDEKTARVDHSHPISDQFSSAEPLEPAHQQLAFYLKIN